jgi:Tol biopolymer transport system component
MNDTKPARSVRARGTALALIGAMVGTLVASGAMLAITPTAGPALGLSPVVINASAGDQYDPHVSGDLVSYSTFDASGESIRYYNFETELDVLVPKLAGDSDKLSDVSNGKIVFSRFEGYPLGQMPIMVYDTKFDMTTEIDPQTAPFRIGSAIGSDTVAFIDYAASAEGEVFAAAIGGAAVRVTTDSLSDQAPAVSPLGDVIVYESCAVSSLNCDIHQARKSSGTWAVTAVTSNLEPDANPDTDGAFVVYDATRSVERDVYWRPVGGGAEQRLELHGQQRDPSISAGVVLFESIPVGESAADLWVYEIATNRLFRITNTAGVDETLNDISSIGGGTFRAVWASNAVGAFDRDVYGATFTIPPVEPPTFTFGGFVAPVDPLFTLNSMKAGGAVPVKFSLGGDQGLDIFAAGYPKSEAITCDSTAPVDGIEQTVTSGGSSLTYDQLTDTYSYVWKTDKAWVGTCRQLVLTFADNSTARANFKFK